MTNGDDLANNRPSRLPPAHNPENRENQLVSLAVDLAERQLIDGSASSAVLVHYLKLGSTRDKLEREKIKKENRLLDIKAETLESQSRIEELYEDVLEAMKVYSGLDDTV